MKNSIGIGLMGLGVIGTSVAKVLIERNKGISDQAGCSVSLKKVLVKDPAKKRKVDLDPSMLTTSVDDIISDADIDIVIEVIGGENPALEYVKKALSGGKHVVTANKEIIAKHGPELFALADENKVDILYEASVGGGIPLTNSFKQDLLANNITSIQAIINATTNYILSNMAKEGIEFDEAVKRAQVLGYAETDPTNDIEGFDAMYKVAILATLAFRTNITPDDVYREGISKLAWRDFQYAKELGYAIKLLAIAKKDNGAIEARVHPTFVPEDLLMAQVNGVFNAVQVEGDLVGRVIFYGQGAGPEPTTSAIVTDVINIAQDIKLGFSRRPKFALSKTKKIKPMADIKTRYYLRLSIADQPGVLAQIAKTLGDNNISIFSALQKTMDEVNQSAEIVLMTHPARESAMQAALKTLENSSAVREVSNFIRVET
ncbi:homoserine dehydrogenase [Chloroflexota bacterium]